MESEKGKLPQKPKLHQAYDFMKDDLMPKTIGGVKYLYNATTSLYQEKSRILSNYVSSSVSFKQAQEQFAKIYSATVNYMMQAKGKIGEYSDIAKEIIDYPYIEDFQNELENLKKGLAESGQELKESFTKKGKELKKKGLELRDIHDKAIFEQRKKYHLWVNENSSPALAMMMSAASLGILATLPMSSLTPCIAVMGLVLGTTYRANKIANTLDHDEKKMGKNQELYYLNWGYSIGKTILAVTIKMKLTVYFTAALTGFISTSPITCSILASFMAYTVCGNIMNAIDRQAKLHLPRSLRDMLYTNPVKTYENLIKTKDFYLKNKELTELQKKELIEEKKKLTEDLANIKNLQKEIKKINVELKKLDPNKDMKTIKELEKKLSHLEFEERKFTFRENDKNAVASLLPNFLNSIIYNTAPGMLIKYTLSSLVGAALAEDFAFTVSSYFTMIKQAVTSTILQPFKGKVASNVNIGDKELESATGIAIVNQVSKCVNSGLNYAHDSLLYQMGYVKEGPELEHISHEHTSISDDVERIVGLVSEKGYGVEIN